MSEMTLTDDELKFMQDQADYFDTHDMSEELEKMPEVQMDFSGARIHVYFEVDRELEKWLRETARARGISGTDLLNEWVREKMAASPASITLPPDLEQAVTAQARLRGVTPEAAVLDALCERFLPKGPTEDGEDSLAEWERLVSAADDHLVASRAED